MGGFFAFKGGNSDLKGIIASFKDAGFRVIPAATRAMAGVVENKYRDGFAEKHDPWGKAWAAAFSNGDTGNRTGALLSVTPTVGAGRVSMRTPRYWGFFQAGVPALGADRYFKKGDARRGGNEPTPRKILPFGASPWDGPIEAEIQKTLEAYFAKKTRTVGF